MPKKLRVQNRKKITLPLIVAIAFIAFGAGIYFNANKAHDIANIDISGTILSEPREISKFNLISSKGTPFTNRQLKENWTFMFFGFSSCGYMCPKILTQLNGVYENLAKNRIIKMPQFVMVSIDPKRDTVKRLNEFVSAFNPRFIGARGNERQIKKMTKELGVVYIKLQRKDKNIDDNYDIDHSGTVFLFNPEGKLYALFSVPHDSLAIANDIYQIQKSLA